MQKCVLGLAAALCFGGMTCAAQENLVKNPGFEGALSTNGIPGGGWWLYKGIGEPKVEVDKNVGFQSKASVQLHADAYTKCVLVSQPFAVAPGDEMHFEVRVRGENIPTNHASTYAGIAFRDAGGRVVQRSYFKSDALSTNWLLISSNATAPAGTVKGEAQLGYTNAPGTLWFDDVVAVITSPVSFSLIEGPKPWAGEQEIAVRLVNRQTNQFHGTISTSISKQVKALPVSLEPNTSRELKLPVNLTGTGDHAYKISLHDESGNSVRVLQGKFHTDGPLALYPACPCYQLVGEGNGETRIDAHVNVNPARLTGLKLTVEVSDATGKQIEQGMAKVSRDGSAGLNFQLPVQAPGVYDITARLVDLTGKEIATAKSDVHVVPPGEARVTLQPDGFLNVAGKTNFPIGMYSCAHYEEVGKAGFTVTHNYGITTGEAEDSINRNEAELKELLDRSWANGMRMMVELPRKAIEQAKWQQVRRRIETFRHHPGLLCWGSEERVARGVAPLANIVALYQLLHKLDPDHPLVLGDTKDVIQKLQVDRRDFFPDPAMDVGIWWWYPIPVKSDDANALEGLEKTGGLMQPPSWLTTTHSKKPLWIAIQSYQKPNKESRFPTPEEYRCQAYLSIINGVKGLFFYTGTGERDYQGKSAGLLNKPEAGHWDYVQQLVRELSEFSPVIMAPHAAAKLEMSPAGVPVEFTERELDGKLYLVAANKSDRPQKVCFSGAALKGRKVQVLYETHQLEMEGKSLTDDFPAFGVHVYRFD